MSAREIVSQRAKEAGVTVADIRGTSRLYPIVCLRAWIAAELYKAWGYTLPQIGRAIGRHHTSVIDLISDARRKRRPPQKRGSYLMLRDSLVGGSPEGKT